MSYIALYREWRPQTFADMVGQEHVTRTLQNALRSNRFAHAYLFSGPRGTGKTSTAKVLAKAINCERGPADEPCNECAACQGITAGSILDVVEIDAASNRGVDEIRDLREQVKYAPTQVRYKVYIVDEVHMLTTEAFNALLKTLEEPPRHVVFILATTEPHKIPATIVSRCQRFDFRRISSRQIVDRLQRIASEKRITAEEDALWLVARAAEGGMRDALSIFDQVMAFGGDQVTVDAVVTLIGGVRTDTLAAIARSIADGDIREVLRQAGELIDEGKDPGQILHDLTVYCRDLLMLKTVPDLEEVRERARYDRTFAEIAGLFDASRLIAMIDQMTQTAQEMKWHTQSRLLLEMLLIRLCKTESHDIKDLIRRIEELERKLAQGNAAAASALQPPAAAGPHPARTAPSGGQRKPAGEQTAAAPSAIPPAESAPTSAQAKRAATSSPSAKSAAAAPARPIGSLVQNPNREWFDKITAGWHQILDEVKRRKITAQAWLLDGEPVAAAGGNVIVAFKNQIHRDTVMKPIHKSVIDQVLTEYLGEPAALVAVLQSDWQTFKQQSATELASAAEDQLVQQVIDMFGPDIVEIED